MKTIITAIALLFTSAAFAQETKSSVKVTYVFFFADVENDGVMMRYFSPILDQSSPINEKCLRKLAEEAIQLKAGSTAKITSIEMQTSRDYNEAEDLILNKYTLPDKKTVYFVLKPEC